MFVPYYAVYCKLYKFTRHCRNLKLENQVLYISFRIIVLLHCKMLCVYYNQCFSFQIVVVQCYIHEVKIEYKKCLKKYIRKEKTGRVS